IKVIADYAGVNHGLVHHYFGSKEELMVALIQHQSQQVLPVIFRDHPEWLVELQQGRRPKDLVKMNQKQLGELMRTGMDRFFSVYDDFDKILSEFVAMSAEMPKVAGKLRGVLRKRRKLLGLIFDNNNPGFATLMMASLTGLLLHYRLDPKIAIKEARVLLRQKLFDQPLK
ncbi:MAG: TetR family transcriptional regulator, partial [SAR324 cluster bacterium]|nr:TetR family transcriptional regulator [SAR324 cluster bacterium]